MCEIILSYLPVQDEIQNCHDVNSLSARSSLSLVNSLVDRLTDASIEREDKAVNSTRTG